MEQKLKNALAIMALVAMAAVSYSAISYAWSYAKAVEPGSYKSFSVTGEGKVTAIPDVATFTATVISEGGKGLSEIQAENTKKVNKVIDYLKTLAIEKKDIETTGFNVEPRYEYYNCSHGGVCPPPTIVGYTVRQSVSVKIRDFAVVGEALANVGKNGANSVSALQFTLDDKEAAINEAKAEAIAKAKERARAMAKAGDFRLGDLLSIDEISNAPYAVAYGRGEDQMMLESAKAAPDAIPTIEPGSQDIVEIVTLRYEIK